MIAAAAAAVLYLFTLEIDDGVLAPVLEEVLEGRDVLLDQEAGELGGAAGVQQVGQELERKNGKV